MNEIKKEEEKMVNDFEVGMTLYSYTSIDQKPCLVKWEVKKITPKGSWVQQTPWGRKKWIRAESKRPRVCRTKAQALRSYLERTFRYVEHCNRRFKDSKDRWAELLNFVKKIDEETFGAEFCQEMRVDVRDRTHWLGTWYGIKIGNE